MFNTKGILVTTTSTLEGWAIQKYLKPVSSHLVVGTNLFSDFFASLTDVFGGNSETYQRKIATLYNDATEQLKAKAFELGANCIVGLRVDMDEISGKGKSMFMINAVGTAVIAKKLANTQDESNSNSRIENVSSETLNNSRSRKRLIKKANADELIFDDETWSYIIENRVSEIYPFIINRWRFLTTYASEAEVSNFRSKVGQYIASLPEEKRYELTYDTLLNEKNEKVINGLSYFIKDLHLVNFDIIKTILISEEFEKKKRILIPLLYDKTFYSYEDLDKMKDLIDLINTTFQERGQRTMKKGVFSSKEKQVWTCECGKQNEIDRNCSGCDKDIFGFRSIEVTPEEVNKAIREKIELVSENINNSLWGESQPEQQQPANA